MKSKSKSPACFSTKIDVNLAEKIKTDLIEQGFRICKPPYTLFSALKKGITCTLYESGSLTVQGKDKDPFIEFYLEPEVLKNFSYTHPLAHVDLKPRIGSDESGKGDFFGPLCVCSLYADEKGVEKLVQMGVRDSKTFSDKKISVLGNEIKKYFRHSVVKMSPEKYNQLHLKFGNLNHLLAWMHATAIQNLSEQTDCKFAIVDQFAKEHVLEDALKKKEIEIDLEQKVRAESDVVVAAASILARMFFVEELENLEKIVALTLPKGASRYVIAAGKKIIQKFDLEMLDKISKTHFKTRNDILNQSSTT